METRVSKLLGTKYPVIQDRIYRKCRHQSDDDHVSEISLKITKMGNETFYHALKINSEVCTGCTHCMNVCPTAAIRIKYGKATINEAACTDCGMCLKTCPRQAIYVEQDDFNQIFKFSYRIILLPSVFIGQFPEDISEEQIFSELHNLGFHYVMEVDKSTGLLMEETKHYQIGRAHV